MRHRVRGRKLNRTYSHLQAMMRNLATSVLDKERLTTTEKRAKECRPLVERLVSLAKKGGLANYRRALGILREEKVAKKLFDEIGPRFKDRKGGYTRILRLSELRLGDRAQKVIFELVSSEQEAKKGSSQKSK